LTPTIPAAAPDAPTAAAAPVVTVVREPLGDNTTDDIPTASAPAVDLLVELPSAAGYISEPQTISGGLPATTLYRATTAEHDLRPLGDDLATGGEDDLLADILAESALVVPL